MLKKALIFSKLDGGGCSLRMFWYHSLFMVECLGKTVIEPISLAGRDPPHMNGFRCFTVGMTQASFFPDSPNNQKEDSSEKMS